jgi:hypothetical protein
MAAGPSSMPPPPGMQTSPMAASPGPPQQSPQVSDGTNALIKLVQQIRATAQQVPQLAPAMQKCNDIIQEAMGSLMQSAPAPQAAAPPIGG